MQNLKSRTTFEHLIARIWLLAILTSATIIAPPHIDANSQGAATIPTIEERAKKLESISMPPIPGVKNSTYAEALFKLMVISIVCEEHANYSIQTVEAYVGDGLVKAGLGNRAQAELFIEGMKGNYRKRGDVRADKRSCETVIRTFKNRADVLATKLELR